MRSTKIEAWSHKAPLFTLGIWVIGLLLISPLLYYFPIPTGYVLRFNIDHPQKYPLGITAVYESEEPWCATALIDLGGLSQKDFITTQLSNGESGISEFIVETEFMRRGCSYKVKRVSIEQGTKEDFENMEVKSLIDYYTRAPWKDALTLAEREEITKEQQNTVLRICPTKIRPGHAEYNDQAIYLINGESFRVIPRRALSGPNKQLLTDSHGIWNISIQRGKENECEEGLP